MKSTEKRAVPGKGTLNALKVPSLYQPACVVGSAATRVHMKGSYLRTRCKWETVCACV